MVYARWCSLGLFWVFIDKSRQGAEDVEVVMLLPQYGIFVGLSAGKEKRPTHMHLNLSHRMSLTGLRRSGDSPDCCELTMSCVAVSRGPLAAARTGRRTRTFPPTSNTPKLPRARAGGAARAWPARHCASARAHKVNTERFTELGPTWEEQKRM